MNKIIPVSKPEITLTDAKSVFKVVKNGWVSSSGQEIEKFEKKFALLFKRKFAITVSNGTAALEIALKTLNLKTNSEVLIPNFNIISAALAVIKNNLKPILVDSSLKTWNMSLEDFKSKITKNTRAAIITHTYGFACDMDEILKICRKNKILVIEDAAEMIGQTFKGQPCGSFGEMSIISLYANKHITTGEGGIIFTNKKKFYEKACSLRNLSFGKKNRFNHDDIGWNYRYTNMQAALGLSQLKRLNKIINKKREIGNYYYNQFKNNKKILIQPPILNKEKNIYWVFGILINDKKFNRDVVVKKLLKKGIHCRNFFWPMNKQKIFIKYKIFKKKKLSYIKFIIKKWILYTLRNKYYKKTIDICC